MTLEIEATYEHGVLKLDQPLPLNDQERVVVTVKPKISHARRTAGHIQWTGTRDDLDYLMGADNHPWAEQ